MWSRGTMALIMEFRTTCKPANMNRTCDGRFLNPPVCVCVFLHVYSLGTPETRRRGRRTRKARRAFTSNPPGLPPDCPLESASLVIISRATLNNLGRTEWRKWRRVANRLQMKREREREKAAWGCCMFVKVHKWLCMCLLVCTGTHTPQLPCNCTRCGWSGQTATRTHPTMTMTKSSKFQPFRT